ncbi:serine/threonine-protein kinase [Streptomyces platensis]|uniref:Serine/threonine-protein kinase n=1 Tax=Streptomyces platensis TaxID=58346 RepID=A0AAE6ND54_STRPT|nr:protein kinase [Streptomyces platensis]OSY47325.1 Serine/threonine-protein kinase AfsK [Streptomyces platensis]QEV50669.1 serine/threonine-protein kinase [Streptomyces platensis]
MISPLLHDDPHAVGPFRILARLGGGGMGTVYLARSAGGRTVAVKTLHTRLVADTALRTRFRLEADAARVIGSAHGAVVVDADPQAPIPWLATEYVLGPPLDTAVEAGGPLPEAAVRALGAGLAAGLEQLHRSEVVHRDLKPSNVLVTAQGPRIIDFGIARAFGDEHLTSVGSAVGTPAFMSPEQAGGQEHAVAGDVFALAGVLVFAATGRGPFGGGAPTDLLYRVRFGEPDLGGVPETLRSLLVRCLAKDPAHRPSTTELRTALGSNGLAPADRGGFAELLPDAVLREIARRSDEVWREPPHRLPPPVPAEIPQAGAAPVPGLSRRRLLSVAGGALLGGGLLGGGGWALLAGSGEGGGATKKDAVDRPKPPAPLWSAGLRCPDSGGEVMRVGRNLAMRAGIVLCGINAESGESTWQANVADPWRSATEGSRIYALRGYKEAGAALTVCEVSQTNGELGKPLVELSAFTGKEQYNQLLCVADGTAYLVARAASGKRWYLVAADLDSGKERWRSLVEGPQTVGTPPALGGAVAGSRVVLCGSPGFGSKFIRLSVHDKRHGRELWRLSETFAGTVPPRLVLDDRNLYIGAEHLTARRLADGELEWLFGTGRDAGDSAGEERRYGAPTVHEGVVYCTEADRGLIAVDAASGTLNWQEKGLSGRKNKRDVAPAVGKRYAYCADDTGLRAIDLRAHEAVWTYETNPMVLTADPKGGRLYVRQEQRTIALPLA